MLIVAITVTLAGLLVSSYHDTIEREQTNLRNLAEAFAAQTHYATLALDLALARGAEHAPQDGADTPAVLPGETLIPARVRRLGPDAPRGPVPGSTPKIGIALPPDGGPATITLARVLPDGPAVIEVDAAYFQRIFDSADLGRGGSVTLHQRDGTMLVRSPTLPKAIGHSFIHTPLFQAHLPRASVGAFEATSPIDGVRRLYGYSAVAGYPLLIVTGRDLADTLAVWRGWLWIGVLAWALLSVTLAVLAWRMSREAARQAALIARLQASERRLADGARYLNAILDSLATPLWVLDAGRRIVLFNRAFLQFTGRTGDAVTGHLEAEVLDPAGAGARARLYADSTADGAGDGVHALEAEFRDGSGATRTVIQLAAQLRSEGDAFQIVNSLTDITDRKQVELRLAYLADHDPLTGLPNLNRLRRVLADALQGEPVVLLLIALERQQEVADLLGIEAGDDAVRQVAARLDALAPAARCVARVKANEFAMLMQLPAGPAHRPVDAIALELHALLSEPVRVGGREFHLAPVIGIATYPQDAASANELMRLADIAKHRARSEAGEPVHFHSESTHIQLDERLTIEEQLRHALARGELTPHYQPKVDIATGQVAGFEVLLRWNSPVLGPVSPARFIPIAEQTGLIIPIGTWVLRTACAQASRWAREHGIATRVAVNLSMRQFYQKDMLKVIADALADAGLAPQALELEITESIAMSRVDVVERLLGGIRDLGVELSIDDFGTGYSSLAYLKRFPVQRLKIDRAFVRDLGRDADSAAIVRSVVALGHGLSMRIVAEGVETGEQLALLRALGCDEYQGYLFARPMDAAAVPALLGRLAPSGA